MSQSNLKHLEHIENAVKQSDLDPSEKSLAVEKIKEWYAEDKGLGILAEELMKITTKIKPILEEAGLL